MLHAAKLYHCPSVGSNNPFPSIEPAKETLFHWQREIFFERDLVVHLHSRIGQPPSHSNVSAAGNSIQCHVPAIVAEHGTISIS
jgi:hypothetical protein